MPEKAAFVQGSFLTDHCCNPPAPRTVSVLQQMRAGRLPFLQQQFVSFIAETGESTV